MARALANFRIWPLSTESTVQDIVNVAESTILITVKPRNIIVYNFADQKLQKDWSVKGSNHLTCGAIYTEDSDTFSTVLNGKTIRTWERDDINIEKAKKVTTEKPVLLLMCTSPRQLPLVVYRDGTCAWHNKSREYLTSQQVDEKAERVEWTGTVQDAEGSYLVIVTKNTNTDQCAAVSYKVAMGSSSVQSLKCTLTRGQSGGCPTGFCLQMCRDGLYLLSLWADGQLCRTALLRSSGSLLEVLCKLPSRSEASSIAALDDTQVAVVGMKGEANEDGIGIWNIKFNILQHWTALPGKLKSPSKVFLVGSDLFVQCQQALYVYQYLTRPATLAAALGKPSQAVPAKPSQDEQSKEWRAVQFVKAILQDLADEEKTSTKRKFKDLFSKLLKEHWTILQQKSVFLRKELGDLIHRFAKEGGSSFWPGQELHQFIKADVFPGSDSPALFSCLITHKELVMVYDCLMHISDIPEAAMVQCLQFFLGTPDEDFALLSDEMVSNEDDQETDGATCPCCPAKARTINKVLVLAANEVFLMDSLRTLQFNHVLSLLQYLLYLLNMTSAAPEWSREEGRPALLKVVEWISVLLDAHFAQLVLSPEAREVLVDHHQVVESQVEFYNDLVCVESLLSQLKEKSVLSRKRNVGLYCIQSLHID